VDEIRTPPSSYFSSGSPAPRASTSHLSLRLSDELMRRLAEVGNDEGLAMSDTIRLVLERGFRGDEESQERTRETAMNDTARPCTSTSCSTKIRWRGPTAGQTASRRCNCSRGHAE